MRKILIIIVLIFFVVKLTGQQKSELRGVWLTNVDSNVLSSDQNISGAMDYLASIGINVVFPVVYNKGYTLYPSKIMDSLFNDPVLPNSPFVNRDFLKRLIIEAHRNGIEVIPWFEFGFATSYKENGGHIIAKFPQWALKDKNGNLVTKNGFDWMSAINPDAQNFILSLMMEVVDNYDVDGVQGDDRLPAMPVEGGYDSVTVQIYKSEHAGQIPPTDYANAAWMKWRSDKLTQFLARLRDSVKSRDKNLVLSCAPSPYSWGYSQYLQDSKSWVQQGLVDNMIPQLYQYDINNYNYSLNSTWNDVGQYNPKIFTAGLLIKIGSYLVDTTFLQQMMNADRSKGTIGESYFFYEGLRANNNQIGNFLKDNYYQKPAILPYRNGNVWRPKAKIHNETDPETIVTGNWNTYLMKGFEGAILRTSDTVNYASIQYNFNIDSSAYYDVFTYRTPNTPWTMKALYTLFSDKDSTEFIVDQSDLSKKGWYKIGTVHLSSGTHKVLKLDNSQLEPGKYLVSDAVMIMINRKLSPDVILSVNKKDAVNNIKINNYKLCQNYPNPFNPSTTFSFEIPVRSFVRITVYNILGEKVQTLLDEEKNAGKYNVKFNAEALSSGIYIVEMRAGSIARFRKTLLLK